MFALPVVFDGCGAKAVALVKFAAAVPAFEFFGVLGIFFDFDIDDDARVGVLPADGLQNFRAVPTAAQLWNDREIDDVRDAPVRDGVREPAESGGRSVPAIILVKKSPKFPLDFVVEQMLYRDAFVRRERRFVQRLDLQKPGGISCDIEILEHKNYLLRQPFVGSTFESSIRLLIFFAIRCALG